MRVTTSEETLQQLLDEALDKVASGSSGKVISAQQRRGAAVLQERLELTPEQTIRLMLAHPSMLDQMDSDENCLALDVLTAELGLTADELAKVIKACPKLLGPSDVVLHRIRRLGELCELHTPEDRRTELRKALLRFPNVLALSHEQNIAPTFRALRSVLGVNASELGKIVVKHPQVLSLHVGDNAVPTLAVLHDEMGGPSQHELAVLVRKLPQILGLSAEQNLRPKLAFLKEALPLTPTELKAAVLREPIVLGTSLEKSLRPNLQLWREHLAPRHDLRAEVLKRGLRWLTCSAATKTKPRLERLSAAGGDPIRLLPRMRDTDAQFERWLANEVLAGAAVPKLEARLEGGG